MDMFALSGVTSDLRGTQSKGILIRKLKFFEPRPSTAPQKRGSAQRKGFYNSPCSIKLSAMERIASSFGRGFHFNMRFAFSLESS